MKELFAIDEKYLSDLSMNDKVFQKYFISDPVKCLWQITDANGYPNNLYNRLMLKNCAVS